MSENGRAWALKTLEMLYEKSDGVALVVRMPSSQEPVDREKFIVKLLEDYVRLGGQFNDRGELTLEPYHLKVNGENLLNTNIENGSESSTKSKTKSHTKKKNKQRKRKVEELKESVNCIVCKDQKRQVLFMPCNHVCCCESCAQKVIDKCVYCNAVIQNKVKFYFP